MQKPHLRSETLADAGVFSYLKGVTSMEINTSYLIPKSVTRTRPGIAMNPTYITIHETDNTNSGADALAHAKLLYNGGYETVASWHFSVDDKSIYQSIPTNEVAWHAGNTTGNYNSIGIEMCVNAGSDYEKTLQNTIWLVAYLMKNHNIALSNVVQHNYWTGKHCPRKLRDSGRWTWFKQQIEKQLSSGSNQPTVVMYRVIVDGNHVGSWQNQEYLLEAIRKEIEKKPSKIVVEKV
jgi:N-acetylmuramoyl-L-alanine amidase CwlA